MSRFVALRMNDFMELCMSEIVALHMNESVRAVNCATVAGGENSGIFALRRSEFMASSGGPVETDHMFDWEAMDESEVADVQPPRLGALRPLRFGVQRLPRR